MDTLLLIVFISVHVVAEGQVLRAPTLTVDPTLIIDTDRVHLNCQSPHNSRCYFSFENSLVKPFPCQHTWSGSELLSLVKKPSPTDVTVICYYYHKTSWSRQSNKIIAHIREMTPPSLAVEPSVITETDQVTLRCQPPAFASGSVCYFFTLNGLDRSSSTCQRSVRGSELLKENQSPPAEVEVQCYYKLYGKQSNSPYSATKNVTIQSSRPELIVEVITDQFVIICSLPEAAKSASTCYLYFGESPQPYFDKDVQKNLTKAKRQICTFFPSFDDLEKKFYTLKTKEISCDYSSVHGHKSVRSDGYNMSAFIKNAPVTQPRVTQPRVTQPHVTTAVSEPVKTTNPSHVTGSETTASTSALPPSTLMRSVLILVVRTVTAFILLLALSFCCTRILVKCDEKRSREEFKSGGINSEDPNCEALPLSEVNHLNTPAASTVYCSPGYSFKQSSVSDDPSQAEMDNSTN